MFSEISGQDYALSILRASVLTERVSHAYLFYGPNGVGKRTTATAFAGLLDCVDPIDVTGKGPEACGRCLQCVKIRGGNHPDVEYIYPIKRSIQIDQIRELIYHVNLRPVEGKKKVYIIDDAGYMGREAANALLKTLEEPPFSVVIILITSNANKLLQTIRSRCQPVYFHPLSRKAIKGILREKLKLSEEDVSCAADAAFGSMANVVEYLGDNEADELIDMLFRGRSWEVSSGLRNDRDAAVKLLERLLIKGRSQFLSDPQDETMGYMENIMTAMDSLNSNANVEMCLDNLFISLNMERRR